MAVYIFWKKHPVGIPLASVAIRWHYQGIFKWTSLNVCCVSGLGHQMSLPGGGPLVNKFEKVSQLGHQMSVTGGQGWWDPSTGRILPGGSLYDDIQCIKVMVTCPLPHGQNDGQTRLKTLPSYNFVYGW